MRCQLTLGTNQSSFDAWSHYVTEKPRRSSARGFAFPALGASACGGFFSEDRHADH